MTENQKNSVGENFNSINEILLKLKKSIKAKETIVFCGAGISLNSGLPLANDLVRYVTEKLNVSKEETETIINSNLPFEAFIEILRENSNINKIFDIFDIGVPNPNHFLLAKLAKAKYLKTIFTTNFDLLIEKALESEELVKGVDFQVFYKEDDLEHISWDDDKVCLIKIHGSVEDKDNMAITLEQVATKVLSEQRKRVIEHIFSRGFHKNVLVLGYSCSDVFDISPQIESIRENHKKVIFIDHHKYKQAINEIEEKRQKNPFKHFAGSKWVSYDTDEMVKRLWDFCLPEDDYLFPKSIIDDKFWKVCVDDWSSEIEAEDRAGIKYGIAGAIFFNISEYESTIVYLEQALRIARDIRDKYGEGRWLGGLGNAYHRLGDYQKAISYYEQALNIARDIGDKEREANCVGGLGNAYYSLGDYQKTISYYEQALNMARDIGDKWGEANWLGNLGNSYHNLGYYQKAISYYEQALNMARDIGDKGGEGYWVGSLGNGYYSLGDYQKTISYYEQALSITRDIGDKQGEGGWLGNVGNAYYSLGEYQKATSYYEEALSIARDIGDKYGEGHWLGGLGSAYTSLGDYQKAISYYEQALRIARDIGDKQGEGHWLGGLGNAYSSLGDYQKSISYYEQALSIARDIGDKRGEGHLLDGLGDAYHSLGDYQKAISYREQALSIARDIGDKYGEGYSLGGLGNGYHSLSDYQKAIEFFEKALVILRPTLGDEHPTVKLIERNLSRAKSKQK